MPGINLATRQFPGIAAVRPKPGNRPPGKAIIGKSYGNDKFYIFLFLSGVW
jgi:hypothetical protein